MSTPAQLQSILERLVRSPEMAIPKPDISTPGNSRCWLPPSDISATAGFSARGKYKASHLNVLFVINSLGGGGSEKRLLRIINSLDRERFKVSLAVSQRGGGYEKLLRENVAVHALTDGKLRSSSLRLLQSIRPLAQLMSTTRPDLVCSLDDGANLVSLRALQVSSIKTKTVLCVENPPSQLFNYSRRPLRSLIFRTLIRIFYRLGDRIVANSEGTRGDLIKLCPWLSGQVDVIYSAAVDENVLRARETVPEAIPPRRGPVLVGCGRLAEQKGFSYLLEAVALVRRLIPVELWILGEGKLKSKLQRHAVRLGIGKVVHFLGFQQEPAQYFARANLFVLSSLFEGFGNVIVEAMAVGTPVVATDCPTGPREIIESGRSGLLVKPSDAQALADGIFQMLGNQALRTACAENGKKRALRFHADKIASEYGSLFENVASAAEESRMLSGTQLLRRLGNRAMIRSVSPLIGLITGKTVATGPFRGMRYLPGSVGSSYMPKLLGTYEKELHGFISDLKNSGVQTIFDVGAAEGYYAVGLALMLPKARVVAFETKERGRALLRNLAEANQVSEKITILGQCDPQLLAQNMRWQNNVLVVCDVEGAEQTVLDPALVPMLNDARIICETHDCYVPGITELLCSRFRPTHSVHIIDAAARKAEDFDSFVPSWLTLMWSPILTWCMSEGRPKNMRWIVCEPLSQMAVSARFESNESISVGAV